MYYVSYDRYIMTRGIMSVHWISVTNDRPVLVSPGQSEASLVTIRPGLSNCVTNTSSPGVTPCHDPVSVRLEPDMSELGDLVIMS